MLASYGHFLAVGTASQWDEATIHLERDAAAWPQLPVQARERIGALVAAFCLGEAAVARELEPFRTQASDPVAAACFDVQRGDEARHARFFERLSHEVLDEAPLAVDPVFADLFGRRLAQVAARLAAGEVTLATAVGLYHLLLEGVVLSAGLSALLAILDTQPQLEGMRRGTELVARDEQWHIGFGARLLQDADGGQESARRLAAEGEHVLAAWGGIVDDETLQRARRLHRRRLHAARLLRREPPPHPSRSQPPRTPGTS